MTPTTNLGDDELNVVDQFHILPDCDDGKDFTFELGVRINRITKNRTTFNITAVFLFLKTTARILKSPTIFESVYECRHEKDVSFSFVS